MRKKGLSALLLAAILLLIPLPASALTVYLPGSLPDSMVPAPDTTGSVPIIYPTSPTGSIYYSAPPFRPTPGYENDEAALSFSRLDNLIWFAWVMREEFELPFTDVPTDSWCYPGVCYVYQKSLMGGVSDTSFAPYELVTRGMAWTVLARMNGANPQTSPGQEWHEPGRAWAMDHGVTDGSNPQAPVTREQWVSMLWRRASEPVVDVDLSVYSDGASVSDYAQDAMRWAISIGVVQGTSGTLSPQQPLSRGELATMILRLAPKPR